MCFFPRFNFKRSFGDNSPSYFNCRYCPECLGARSSEWALRAVYEAKVHLNNCMVTLTYDDYKRDSKGNIIGELPPDPDKKVNVRDCQLFIKRVRKMLSKQYPDIKIKYLLSAEYGKRTHRAHYHAIFFGWCPDDLVYYKKSKRGNVIYKSNLLTDLWRHGICTVDSISIRSNVAAYCTKYMSKNYGADDTFMLCSNSIGVDPLLKSFNGIGYVVEGKLHPIPRIVWNRYILSLYSSSFPFASYRYVNKEYSFDVDADGVISNLAISNLDDYRLACDRRVAFRVLRDSLPLYSKYLEYWSNRISLLDKYSPAVDVRISLLDDRKFHNYKSACLDYLSRRISSIPRSPVKACRGASRPITASDTITLHNGVHVSIDIGVNPFDDVFLQKCSAPLR